MKLQQYMAHQLSKPTGFLGKFVLGLLWNRRNARLNDDAFSHLELKETDRVLDVGFGGGYLIERMIPCVKHGWVAGIDISRAMVANCRARHHRAVKAGILDICCGSVESIPYPDCHFTKVSSVNSIFYWGNPQDGMAEIYRVLRQGGKFVLTYTKKEDLAKKGFAKYGVETYEDNEIRLMLVKAGFRNIHLFKGRDRYREFICMTALK